MKEKKPRKSIVKKENNTNEDNKDLVRNEKNEKRSNFSVDFFERFEEFLNLHNQKLSSLGSVLGLSRLYFNTAKSRRCVIGLDVYKMILEQYPELNPEWLLFGRGSMIRGLNITDNAQMMLLMKKYTKLNKNKTAIVNAVDKIDKLVANIKAFLDEDL